MAAIVKESTDLVVAVAGQGLVLSSLGANYVAAAAEVGRAIHEQSSVGHTPVIRSPFSDSLPISFWRPPSSS
jgi:hypothetical protein